MLLPPPTPPAPLQKTKPPHDAALAAAEFPHSLPPSAVAIAVAVPNAVSVPNAAAANSLPSQSALTIADVAPDAANALTDADHTPPTPSLPPTVYNISASAVPDTDALAEAVPDAGTLTCCRP